MPLSTDVKLPRTQLPIFPDKCVVSGESNPGETSQFKVDSLSWSSTHAASKDGAVSVIDVPVMNVYQRKLRWQKKLQLLLYIVYGTVAAVVAMNVDDWLGRDLSRLQTLIAVVVGVIPILVLQVSFPPAFAVRASGDKIVYEFKSAEYAKEFEALNRAE